VTATDLDGNRFTEEGEGLLARAFQHEYDHLEGTMIKDRMSRTAKIKARGKLKQMLDDYEQTDAAS
jgi:peptide deformylase